MKNCYETVRIILILSFLVGCDTSGNKTKSTLRVGTQAGKTELKPVAEFTENESLQREVKTDEANQATVHIDEDSFKSEVEVNISSLEIGDENPDTTIGVYQIVSTDSTGALTSNEDLLKSLRVVLMLAPNINSELVQVKLVDSLSGTEENQLPRLEDVV